MISQTVARRYAQALLTIGREDGQYETYGQELADFVTALSVPGVADAMTNPIYPADIRRGVLTKVSDKMKLSPIAKNFLHLLLDKGRLPHIVDIAGYYRQLVDEANNIKRATIITARPVDENVKGQVKETLEKITGKNIILEAREDSEIIGGLIAQVGDLTMDGSVRTQLASLRETLIKG